MSELRERHLGAMRGLIDALAADREVFVRTVLRDPSVQTVSAHLFLDAFFVTVEDAVAGRDPYEFFGWLHDALSVDSPLRPPAAFATSLASALRAAIGESELGDGRAWIREIERSLSTVFAKAEERPARTALDEVDAAIDALVVRLETIDPLTAEHSRAVASWCARIGRALGFTDSEVVDLSRAGLVHDVGKASLPAAILTAPRALEEHEWTIVRAHVIAGEEIAHVQPLIQPYRAAIVAHHERLDGSGYPSGLRGERIPLQARVVAVADAFNAMIGHRPYRAPLAPSDALDEIERGSGTDFDPEIVRALISVLGA